MPARNRLAEFRAARQRIFQANLAQGKAVIASNTRGDDPAFAPSRAVDGRLDTYWATDDAQTRAWLEVDLGRPTRIGIACLQEYIPLGQRVESYRLDYLDGEQWKTLSAGTTIGHKKLERFDPVTARRVRLMIEQALAAPALSALALYDAPRA